jgi:hypothetical protein
MTELLVALGLRMMPRLFRRPRLDERANARLHEDRQSARITIMSNVEARVFTFTKGNS